MASRTDEAASATIPSPISVSSPSLKSPNHISPSHPYSQSPSQPQFMNAASAAHPASAFPPYQQSQSSVFDVSTLGFLHNSSSMGSPGAGAGGMDTDPFYSNFGMGMMSADMGVDDMLNFGYDYGYPTMGYDANGMMGVNPLDGMEDDGSTTWKVGQLPGSAAPTTGSPAALSPSIASVSAPHSREASGGDRATAASGSRTSLADLFTRPGADSSSSAQAQSPVPPPLSPSQPRAQNGSPLAADEQNMSMIASWFNTASPSPSLPGMSASVTIGQVRTSSTSIPLSF